MPAAGVVEGLRTGSEDSFSTQVLFECPISREIWRSQFPAKVTGLSLSVPVPVKGMWCSCHIVGTKSKW
jgi:hypothetical protein